MRIPLDENVKVYLREGALRELAGILEHCSAKRILFVVDRGAYDASGVQLELDAAFLHREIVRFREFEVNPKIEDVERGVELSKTFRPDMIVTFGGGTAIDLGKLIGILPHQLDDCRAIVTGLGRLTEPGTPLIAIPTTAGTGSEATHFAVVYVDGEKYSVASPLLVPRYAIIDPKLTYALPSLMTAATGLDAFCQALESWWAVGSNEESRNFAKQGMRLAFEHLSRAVHQPTPESRLGMCQAAHWAGKAINISKTTAPHALSYHITSRYGLPHGIAVAMTLSPLLRYNSQVSDDDCQDPRSAVHVVQQISQIVELLGARNVDAACLLIEGWIEEIGCPKSLAAAGIVREDEIVEIVRSVNVERMSNNPRRLDPEILIPLLMSK